MGLRTKPKSADPVEVLVEHVTEGTVTPFEFRVYYPDGSYDLSSNRTMSQLVGSLGNWLSSEGYSDDQIDKIIAKLPSSRGGWEFTIKFQ